ncbi:CLUMA_CG018630, isoform A [Clunio marinus]|uniref:CLUMA_CG018630, isoform A n=1 Tax=Clunio marinus TaxID=568069 RepID=A0A1J1IZI0_9DIPT|nr:CLUMA_CG018630, isoform A [Clunio marinus]
MKICIGINCHHAGYRCQENLRFIVGCDFNDSMSSEGSGGVSLAFKTHKYLCPDFQLMLVVLKNQF